MQRYISPPLTLQGYKFSLLLYVAVTSVSPLRAWLYNDGHVLLALHPYRESVEGRDWRSAHSTRLDAHPDHVQHILGKNGLLRYLAASQLDAHQVWSSIEDAVGLAILSVATYVVPSAKGAGGEQDAPHAGKAQGSKAPRRFKLLAAHVVLDVNLTPWVIKLDPSPSLPLTATGAVKASARAAQPAEGDQDSDGAQGAAQVVGHGPGQQGPAGIGGEHNDDSEYTSWLFEGDVHDMTKELTKELEELKAQQFRVSHMRRRQQRRHDAAVPSPRSLRALLASAGPDASFRRRAAGAPLSPSSVLRVDMIGSLLQLVGVRTGSDKLAASAASLRSRAVLSKVGKCLSDASDSVLAQTSFSSKMSPVHINAIGEYEVERLRRRQGSGWLPLHPTPAAVKKRLAQVKARKLDVLLQWWLQHGRAKCFVDDANEPGAL